MKTSENCEIKPSQIPQHSPKSWKYISANNMAYTVFSLSDAVLILDICIKNCHIALAYFWILVLFLCVCVCGGGGG